MNRPRRTAGALVSALVGVALVATGCGSGGGSGSDGKVTLTVGLFGTFGFKEAGLYDRYMADHPGVTIKETSVAQEQDYYQGLQTRLAAGSGLADIQGIEVGRIADVVGTQPTKWADLNPLGASALKGDFYDWKWQAATTKDGKTLGLGTDIGPMAVCYRPDLFRKAGLPTDREQVGQAWSTWEGYLDLGRRYTAKAPAKSAFTDSAGGLFSAVIGQSEQQYYAADGTLSYRTNPAVKNAWDLAMRSIADRSTARLKQFDPEWNKGFSNGAFATLACPAWMLAYIRSQAGEKAAGTWDVARAPGNGGNWGGSYLGIPAASKHRKEAYALLSWLSAPEQQVTMWTKGQHFPSNSKAAADPRVVGGTDAYFSNAPIGKIFNDSASKLPVAVIGPKAGVVANGITNGIVTVEQQGKSPGDAWKATVKEVQSAVGDG